jgi:hypothetical protein
MPRLVAQRRGWPHRAGGDEGEALHWSDVTVPSCAGAGLTFIPLSRVPLSSFEGCDMEAVHSVTELTPAFPYSSRTVPGMAAQGGLAEQRQDMIPRWCQKAGVARILLLPGHPQCARALNALVGGVGVASRALGGLERDGESPEGASAPRARRVSPEGVSAPRARWRIV